MHVGTCLLIFISSTQLDEYIIFIHSVVYEHSAVFGLGYYKWCHNEYSWTCLPVLSAGVSLRWAPDKENTIYSTRMHSWLDWSRPICARKLCGLSLPEKHWKTCSPYTEEGLLVTWRPRKLSSSPDKQVKAASQHLHCKTEPEILKFWAEPEPKWLGFPQEKNVTNSPKWTS